MPELTINPNEITEVLRKHLEGFKPSLDRQQVGQIVEVGELRQRAQEDINAQVERAMADLHAKVAELAIELAEKVVERNLDRDTNLALIESYINQVSSQRA